MNIELREIMEIAIIQNGPIFIEIIISILVGFMTFISTFILFANYEKPSHLPKLLTLDELLKLDFTYANKHKQVKHKQRASFETPNGEMKNCDNNNLSEIQDKIVTNFEQSLPEYITNREEVVLKAATCNTFKLYLEKQPNKKLKKIKFSNFNLYATNKNNNATIRTIIELCNKLNYKIDITVDIDPVYNPGVENNWVRFKNY